MGGATSLRGFMIYQALIFFLFLNDDLVGFAYRRFFGDAAEAATHLTWSILYPPRCTVGGHEDNRDLYDVVDTSLCLKLRITCVSKDASASHRASRLKLEDSMFPNDTDHEFSR